MKVATKTLLFPSCNFKNDCHPGLTDEYIPPNLQNLDIILQNEYFLFWLQAITMESAE